MTTNVPRGAGRPAATAKRNRAAQRTPLPPRAGEVEAAREVIKAGLAEQQRRAHFASMTVPQLQAYAREHGWETAAKLRRKPELLASVQHWDASERARAEAAQPAKPQQRAKKAPRTNGEAPAASRGTSGNTRQADLVTMAESAPDTKSWAKALPFRAAAAALGWNTSVGYAPDGAEVDLVEATVTRGGESITIQWQGGVFLNNCYYVADGRSPIKLRNASAAKQRMALPPEKAAEEAARVTAHKVARPVGVPKAERKPRAYALPFTEASLDQEVLDALYGRKIIWLNRISGEEEEDVVPALEQGTRLQDGTRGVAKQHHQPRITEGARSGRTINFVGAAGFRSVCLASIVRVR